MFELVRRSIQILMPRICWKPVTGPPGWRGYPAHDSSYSSGRGRNCISPFPEFSGLAALLSEGRGIACGAAYSSRSGSLRKSDRSRRGAILEGQPFAGRVSRGAAGARPSGGGRGKRGGELERGAKSTVPPLLCCRAEYTYLPIARCQKVLLVTETEQSSNDQTRSKIPTTCDSRLRRSQLPLDPRGVMVTNSVPIALPEGYPITSLGHVRWCLYVLA